MPGMTRLSSPDPGRAKNRRARPGPGKTTRSMPTPVIGSLLRLAPLVLVLVGLIGCGRKIGDECKDLLDCNTEDNTRSCDLSQPGGYCTIDGCDESSCPDEA